LRRYSKNRHSTSNISEYPEHSLTYFTGLVDILVGMIIPLFVWQSPKGRCYGNQLNLEDGRRHRQKRHLLLASKLDNGLAYRKSAFQRLNGNIRATLYPHLVNNCLIIWKFTLLKRAIFAAIRPQLTTIFIRQSRCRSKTDCKIAILISAKQSAIISVHFVEIGWDSVQWPWSLRYKKLYSRRRVERPLLFPSAFDNWLADRKSAFKVSVAIIRLHRIQIWWTSVQQPRSFPC